MAKNHGNRQFLCNFAIMKQTIEDYIRHDEEFRLALLKQEGGIMKYWTLHPKADFDAILFEAYEKELVESYHRAFKRNRSVASMSERELKLKARNWIHHTEKELHYQIALQPILEKMPAEVKEQANLYFEEYLADSYEDYRRCYYPNGITPVEFYGEVITLYSSGGLARNCMDFVLREHHHPKTWSETKGEYSILREFFLQQYLIVIDKDDTYKKLRQGVKQKLTGKTVKECRQEAIKTMTLARDFARMIYSCSEVTISDCTGQYKVDKDYLRKLAGNETALRLLGNTKIPPLHECFFKYVQLLNDIGRIWAARLLKECSINMHELEKETGCILFPVSEPTLQPDGKEHGNYSYYVDKDFLDPLDDQCCIFDENEAKELLAKVKAKLESNPPEVLLTEKGRPMQDRTIVQNGSNSLNVGKNMDSINLGIVTQSIGITGKRSVALFNNIADQIIKYLDEARVSIHVAIAWFTNQRIADKLVEKKKEGLDVKVVYFKDYTNCKFGVDLDNIPFKAICGTRGGIMHNKFCVIDNQKVITGSYNWSENAENKNDENATVVYDNDIASYYSVEFRRLFESDSPR